MLEAVGDLAGVSSLSDAYLQFITASFASICYDAVAAERQTDIHPRWSKSLKFVPMQWRR